MPCGEDVRCPKCGQIGEAYINKKKLDNGNVNVWSSLKCKKDKMEWTSDNGWQEVSDAHE